MAVRRFVLLTVALCSAAVQATSVIEVTLEELLQHSAVVFEGQVSRVQVRENGNRAIQTLVTFEIIDVIKGDVQGEKLTLGFMGGELAGKRLSVSSMQMPALHEHGIYFVESTARSQVHPLYGWSQGHLLLEEDDDGTDRVFSRSGRPVRGVVHTPGGRSGKLSHGVARGLLLGDSADDAAALDNRDFKALLRAMQ